MKHTIDYADMRGEAFTHDLASSSSASPTHKSKRLTVQVVLADPSNNEEPTVKYVVYIGGGAMYAGKDLEEAVITYNSYD